MSTYLGNQLLSGVATNTISNAHSLFDFKWSDHILNEMSWLRSDTFSWHNGLLYKAAYDMLESQYNSGEQSIYAWKQYGIVGSLNDNNGIVNGFELDSYIKPKTIFNPGSSNWEINLKIKTPSATTSTPMDLFNSMYNKKDFGIHIQLQNGNQLKLYLSSNGTSWDITSATLSSYTLTTNTDYYLKLVFNGSSYVLYSSTTGAFSGEQRTEISVSSSAKLYSGMNSTSIGQNPAWSNGSFTGFVDLSQCNFSYNGSIVWRGIIPVQYTKGQNGMKIISSSNVDIVEKIYRETGIAWYYIIDTVNKKFKLPRTKYGFSGLRDEVGKYIEPGVPNITGGVIVGVLSTGETSYYGALTKNWTASNGAVSSNDTRSGFSFNASASNTIYGNSNTVQPPATQMYLYFYVGEYSQSQAEQVATLDVEMFNNKADTNMLNLTNAGKNIANWSNNVTNCITEIPQDIKMEVNYPNLVLKAGSKVYIPNGTDVFDEVTISDDVIYDLNVVGTNTRLVFYNRTLNELSVCPISLCYSSTSEPTLGSTFGVWYDLTTNTIKRTDDSGTTWVSDFSFPISIASMVASTSCTIDQIFYGIGYIGSTIFALPGVKGVIPDGRNEDGTMKNIVFTTPNVITYTIPSTTNAKNISIRLREAQIGTGDMLYDEKLNLNSVNGSKRSFAKVGKIDIESGVVTNFSVNSTFHALDYNDKGTIAGWGMPSDRYIDLTLGASGSTYTAPANGWFTLRKASSSNNQFATFFYGSFSQSLVWSLSGRTYGLIFPAKKGAVVQLNYDVGGTLQAFRFYYAEGEQ